MTERLRDIVATDDPALAELARLVRASGDPAPRPGAQDRVWRALVDRSTARPQQRWQIAVVAVLVLVVVLPAAVAGVRWIVATPVSPSIPSPVPSPVPPPAPSPATPRSPHPARSGPAADPAPVAPAVADAAVALSAVPATPARPIGDGEVARGAPTDAPASAESSGSSGSGLVPQPTPTLAPVPAPAPEVPPAGERRPHLPGRTSAPVRDPPTAGGAAVRVRESSRLPMDRRAASGPDAADTGLVVDAMRRLRRGHDPRAALRELDAYLARFPDGDLAEEALALAIEARAALGDPTACSLAEQYVQRHPHGQLREPIERIRLELRDPASQRCPDGPAPQPR